MGDLLKVAPHKVSKIPVDTANMLMIFITYISTVIFLSKLIKPEFGAFFLIAAPFLTIKFKILKNDYVFSIIVAMAMRALLTRFFFTVQHPLAGSQQFSSNWQKMTYCTDIMQTPELVPGHQITYFSRLISNDMVKKSPSILENLSRIIAILIAFSALYLPALLWRWSIKSTAWFYFPLLWVGRGWVQKQGAELVVWGQAYRKVIWNWFGLLLTVGLITISLAPIVGWGKLVQLAAQTRAEGAPFSPFLALFVLDWHSLANQPWNWFYLPAWTLTIWLFLGLDQQGAELGVGGDPAPRLAKLRLYMWGSNLRYVLTNIGLAISLIYVLRAMDTWEQVQTFWQGLVG